MRELRNPARDGSPGAYFQIAGKYQDRRDFNLKVEEVFKRKSPLLLAFSTANLWFDSTSR
jgi:hypothetical protein